MAFFIYVNLPSVESSNLHAQMVFQKFIHSAFAATHPICQFMCVVCEFIERVCGFICLFFVMPLASGTYTDLIFNALDPLKQCQQTLDVLLVHFTTISISISISITVSIPSIVPIVVSIARTIAISI